MNYIIKGTNKPIVLKFSQEIEYTDISISLVNSFGTIKHWGEDDVDEVDETTLTLPLTQQQTINFPEGTALLEIKWLDDDEVEFAKLIELEIINRQDTTILV